MAAVNESFNSLPLVLQDTLFPEFKGKSITETVAEEKFNEMFQERLSFRNDLLVKWIVPFDPFNVLYDIEDETPYEKYESLNHWLADIYKKNKLSTVLSHHPKPDIQTEHQMAVFKALEKATKTGIIEIKHEEKMDNLEKLSKENLQLINNVCQKVLGDGVEKELKINLSLVNLNIDDSYIDLFMKFKEQLWSLDLKNNLITDKGAMELLNLFTPKKSLDLNLKDNPILSEDVRSFMKKAVADIHPLNIITF